MTLRVLARGVVENHVPYLAIRYRFGNASLLKVIVIDAGWLVLELSKDVPF